MTFKIDSSLLDLSKVRVPPSPFFGGDSIGFGGRVNIGDGWNQNGAVDGSVTGGSWLEDIGSTLPGELGWDYFQDQFRFTVITSVGSAVSGVARTSNDTDAVGVASVAYNRHAPATGRKGWGGYTDYVSVLGGVGFGIELNAAILVPSIHGASDPHKAPGPGLVQGLRVMAGSDGGVFGRSYGVPAGIYLGDNGAKFLSGIVIGGTALLRDGETDSPSATGFTDGNAHAIRLGYRHMVSWTSRNTDGVGFRPEVFTLNSTITNSAIRLRMDATDGGLVVGESVNPASNFLVVGYAADATAGIKIEPATGSGSPGIRANSPTRPDLNMEVRGQGTGKVAIGNKQASADAPVDGFVELVGYNGGIIKIATIA